MYPDEWTERATAIIAAPSAGPQNRIIAFVGEDGDAEDYGETGDDFRGLDDTDRANAAFIVCACNNFEHLAEALADLLGVSACENPGRTHVRELCPVCKARAALAAAGIG
jgi:hypothetical protein